MSATLTVRTWGPFEERYRELLLEDYSRQALEGALSLLWTTVAQSVAANSSWARALEYQENARTGAEEIDGEMVERIATFASFYPGRALPPMPPHFSAGRPSRTMWQAVRVWNYLALPALVRLKGETGFFRDIQSLLFLNTVHYLLPHLQAQSLRPEHDCLVQALHMHAVLAWSDDPAHQCFLLSVLLDYLGESRARMDLLHRSFLLTPPSDHSYLTKAQAYWCDLHEHGEGKKALSFLLDLARTSPPEHLPEIKEMLADMTAANGHGK